MTSAKFSFSILALALFFPPVEAKEIYDGYAESVSCYQDGQLLFKNTERIRNFTPTTSMTLLADISAGQVQDTETKLYASDRADVVCVVTNKK